MNTDLEVLKTHLCLAWSIQLEMRDFQWFNVWEQCTTEHLATLDGDASVSVPVSNISDVKPKDTNMNRKKWTDLKVLILQSGP